MTRHPRRPAVRPRCRPARDDGGVGRGPRLPGEGTDPAADQPNVKLTLCWERLSQAVLAGNGVHVRGLIARRDLGELELCQRNPTLSERVRTGRSITVGRCGEGESGDFVPAAARPDRSRNWVRCRRKADRESRTDGRRRVGIHVVADLSRGSVDQVQLLAVVLPHWSPTIEIRLCRRQRGSKFCWLSVTLKDGRHVGRLTKQEFVVFASALDMTSIRGFSSDRDFALRGSNMLTRREYLQRVGTGLGTARPRRRPERQQAPHADAPAASFASPLAPKKPHFKARAKRIIHLFMNGGPSQVDTFDPKPALTRWNGQRPPASNLRTERSTAGLMMSPFRFESPRPVGPSRISEIFPHLQTRGRRGSASFARCTRTSPITSRRSS